jgi:hypothetical protein
LLSILEAHINIQKTGKEEKNKKKNTKKNEKVIYIYIYISGDNMKNT